MEFLDFELLLYVVGIWNRGAPSLKRAPALWGVQEPLHPKIASIFNFRRKMCDEGFKERWVMRVGCNAGMLEYLKELGPSGAPWVALWSRERGSPEGTTYLSQLEAGLPVAIGWIVDPNRDDPDQEPDQPLEMWVRSRYVPALPLPANRHAAAG